MNLEHQQSGSSHISSSAKNFKIRPTIRDAEHLAKKIFGFDDLRPNQVKVLQTILNGQDTLAVLPTGGGKSLCYALPAMLEEGMVVVVSPLIALIRDQVVKMRKFGIPAAAVDSLQSPEEKRQVFEALKRNRVKLLFVSPERLALPSFRALLLEQNLILIAVDEAHCISQWGHHFRAEYRKIGEYVKDFPEVTKLALTATARKNVREDIVRVLQMHQPSVQVNSPARDNLKINIEQYSTVSEQFDTMISDTLSMDGQGIIYASTRKSVEDIAKQLRAYGHTCASYHGGMEGGGRDKALTAFINGSVKTVVATNAFGLGIDKADIRYVFHYGIPQSFEQYIQEIGRGGRDGLRSYAQLYFTNRDAHVQKFILEKSFVEPSILLSCANLLDSIFSRSLMYTEPELVKLLQQKQVVSNESALVCLDTFYRAGWLSKFSNYDPHDGYVTSYKLEFLPHNKQRFIDDYKAMRDDCFAKFDAMKKFVYSKYNWHGQINKYFET